MNKTKNRAWVFMSIISATLETEVGPGQSKAGLGQKHKTLSEKLKR
jgi:hypothetical protein